MIELHKIEVFDVLKEFHRKIEFGITAAELNDNATRVFNAQMSIALAQLAEICVHEKIPFRQLRVKRYECRVLRISDDRNWEEKEFLSMHLLYQEYEKAILRESELLR